MRVLAIGAEPGRDPWLWGELQSIARRLRTRWPDLVAVVPLSTGVGVLWGSVCLVEGLQLEVWLPHPEAVEHWARDRRDQAMILIDASARLGVCYDGPAMEPAMHSGLIRYLAGVSDVVVACGPQYEPLAPVGRPLQAINPQTRQSRWRPEGRRE